MLLLIVSQCPLPPLFSFPCPPYVPLSSLYVGVSLEALRGIGFKDCALSPFFRPSHLNVYLLLCQDCSLEEFLREQCPSLLPPEEPTAHRKQESIWELFTSECVYFLDQLMVLKEVQPFVYTVYGHGAFVSTWWCWGVDKMCIRNVRLNLFRKHFSTNSGWPKYVKVKQDLFAM